MLMEYSTQGSCSSTDKTNPVFLTDADQAMSLSKQSTILGFYNELLANSPLLTKVLTSGIIGFTGAYVSSKLRVISSNFSVTIWTKLSFQKSHIESLWKSTGPLTTYSALFAAPITHYFYNILQKLFGSNIVAKVLVDRLVFCPVFVFFTLYILDRLQVCSYALARVDRLEARAARARSNS